MQKKKKTFRAVFFNLFPLTEPMERKLLFGAPLGSAVPGLKSTDLGHSKNAENKSP